MTFSDSYTLPSSLVIQSSIKQPHHQLQSQRRHFDRRMILIIDIVSIGGSNRPKLLLYSTYTHISTLGREANPTSYCCIR